MLSKNTFIYLIDGSYKIQDIALCIGYKKCSALTGFHAFTGCDVSGKFSGFGKQSWWCEFASSEEDVVTAFQSMGRTNDLSEATITCLEKFVCKVYCGKKGRTTTLPETRWYLYCKNPGKSESLPPTLGALREHIKRTHYVASVWNSSHNKVQMLPLISECGWEVDIERGYVPIATLDVMIPERLIKSMKCKCVTGCGVRCSCSREGTSCTDMCECINCENTDFTKGINIGEDEDI